MASNEDHQAYVDAYVMHIVSTVCNCMQLFKLASTGGIQLEGGVLIAVRVSRNASVWEVIF